MKKLLSFLFLCVLCIGSAWGESKTLIIDGSKLTTTATTEASTLTFDGIDIVFSDGAKMQSSSGDNKFTEKAILIGKSGTYIYNKTAIPGKITKFEIYANKGASAKVSVGVVFSTTAISAYATGTNTYTATLSTLDNVYDCSSKLPANAKYFWYQVTNANNSQVQFRITYEEEGQTEQKTLESIEVSSDHRSFNVGDDFVKETVTATYSDNTTADVTDNAEFSGYNMSQTGTQTVNVSYAEGGETKTTSYTITVSKKQTGGTTKEDVITASDLAATGTSYTIFSGVTKTSNAEYAGQSAKNGSGNIQMRATSPSGIVSTTSGGLIRQVKITVGSGTNQVDVYGSNTPYTAASNLYATGEGANQGTKLGSLTATGTITINDDYKYVGVRSYNGAIYLTNITFVWEEGTTPTKTLESIAVKTAPTKVIYTEGETFNPAGLVITATYDDESTQDIAYAGNESKFSFSPALTTVLSATDNKVTITYGEKTCDQAITVSELPSHIAHFSINGNIDETDNVKAKEGADITFPAAPKDINDKTFVGWVENEISGTTDEAPVFVTSATMGEADVTYYAVFATETGEGEPTFSKYQEVTDEPADWTGTYIMVVNGKVVEKDGNKTASMIADKNVFNFATEQANKEVVVAKTANGYSIYLNEKNMYLGQSGTSTSITMDKTYTEKTFDFVLSTTGINSVSADNRWLMANGTAVRLYVPGTDYQYVKLYKRIETAGTSYSNYCTLLPYVRENLTANAFGTLCLQKASSSTEGATFYSIAGKRLDNEGKVVSVVLDEVEGNLEAGVPYIFRTDAESTSITVALTGEPVAEAGVANGLHGTFVTYAFENDASFKEGDYYVVKDFKIQASKQTNSGVNANRAYIVMSEVDEIKDNVSVKGRIELGFDGIVDAINSINADKKQLDGAIYNLNGQRLNGLQKGMNIVNGKKLFVK